MKIASRNYFWLSLSIHGLIVTVFILHFNNQHGLEKISNPTILSYATHSPASSKIKTHSDKSIFPKPNLVQHSYVTTKNQNQTTLSEKNEEQPILTLLHNAIAEKQTYPEEALASQQSGIVTIGFMLYPNGELKKIHLVKSSGISELDNAAITAVKSVSAVPHVSRYLEQANYFFIDVIYRE
jgi:TonB family protein